MAVIMEGAEDKLGERLKNCPFAIIHLPDGLCVIRRARSTALCPSCASRDLTEGQLLSLCVLSFSPDSQRLSASALKNKPAALKNNHAALTKNGYVENKANTLIHTKTKECSERLDLIYFNAEAQRREDF